MRYEKRSKKDGTGVYYSFVYYDSKTKKQTRLSRKDIKDRFGKDITTEKEARECLKLFEAKYQSEKFRIEKRLAWEKEFFNFTSLVSQYETKQKVKAPNSWQNNVFYLKHYALKYLLEVRRVNNIELFPEYYEDFRAWLETAKTVRGNSVIAVSSRNHAIKALNTFMKHLYKQKLISAYVECEAFPAHLVNKRDLDDVITPEEMESVYSQLIETGHSSEALLFRFLYFSGMRFNEALAISIADLYQGAIDNDFLAHKTKVHNIEYHGYIVSDGQFGGIAHGGHVIRLPFKGCKVITEAFNRVIPVVDKVLWNSLVDVAEARFNSAKKNANRRDLLLFPNIDDTTATNRLKAAFEACKLRYRSWHCCRHSRATYLYGGTSDAALCRVWLGHRSQKVLENYLHIFQKITRNAKAKELTGTSFGLRRV